MIVQMKDKDKKPLRAELLQAQRGLCWICKTKIKEGEACLDHSHVKKVKGTGLVRGVLCRNCNIFIAKSENNCKRYGITNEALPKILRACADYLERDHYPYRHPSERPKIPVLKKSSYNKLKKAYKGKAKFPFFRHNAKGKPLQKMTAPLQKLFNLYKIVPEFYK